MNRFGFDLLVLISLIANDVWFRTLLCSWAYTSQHADKEWRASLNLLRLLLVLFHRSGLKALLTDPVFKDSHVIGH